MSRESIKKFPQSEIPQDDGRVLESGFRTSLQIGEQPKKRKTLEDAYAATLILQNYLDQ